MGKKGSALNRNRDKYHTPNRIIHNYYATGSKLVKEKNEWILKHFIYKDLPNDWAKACLLANSWANYNKIKLDGVFKLN